MAWTTALLRELLALTGHGNLGASPISALLLVGMIGAVAAIAVAITARLAALFMPDVAVTALTSDTDLPALRSQSNPDADGHTRARAPGATR